MPKFFFDITDGTTITADQIGVELPDPGVARTEATRTLSEIAAQELPGDGPFRHFAILVRGEDETVLFEVALTFSTVEGPDKS